MPKPEWEQHRERIINHMNDDHVEHMVDMVHHFFGVKPNTVKLVDLDSEGFHIQADEQTHYLPFEKACVTPREIAAEAAQLANFAREQLDKIGQ